MGTPFSQPSEVIGRLENLNSELKKENSELKTAIRYLQEENAKLSARVADLERYEKECMWEWIHHIVSIVDPSQLQFLRHSNAMQPRTTGAEPACLPPSLDVLD